MAAPITTKIDVLSTIPPAVGFPKASARDASCRSRYPDDAWRQIRREGLFLACVPLMAALVITILTLVKFDEHDIVRAILICGLGGITGSWMYSVRVYVHSVIHGHWRSDYVVERLTTPFTGIFLAVSAYTLIETGMLGVTFSHNQDTDPAFYSYAIGFFVGLFSEDVMGKLTGVAKTFFGKPTDDGAGENRRRAGDKLKDAGDKAAASSFRVAKQLPV